MKFISDVKLKQIAASAEFIKVPDQIRESLNKQEIIHPEKTLYYRFFYFLSKILEPDLCVELGTNRGVAAACLALGNPLGKVISIDNMNKEKFKGCEQPNIDYWIQDSLALLKKDLQKIDILFIDTSSKGSRNRDEYDYWISRMSRNGIVFIDDIFIVKDYRGKITTDLMAEFWREFKPKGNKIELPLHGKNGFGAVILNGQS